MPLVSKPFYKNPLLWVLFFISIFIFNTVNKSPVSCASSDPRWTLLTAQSLLETHTMRLDKYADLPGGYTIRKGGRKGYAIELKNGHYYNFFPMGSSLSSLPFVWLETQILAKHMKIHSQNSIVQKRIAALVAVGIFLLLYMIASLYVARSWSIVIALTFWLGTSLSSTLGQGLWSHTFAILYALISLYLTLKITIEGEDRYWIVLGLTLFMAYLSRPTFSLLSIAIIMFLFFNHKRIIALKTSLVVFAFLGLLVLYSLLEFDQLLPSYYMPKRLGTGEFWEGLHANTFSPSRGLFAFSPFVLLFFLALKDTYTIFKTNKTLLILLGWVIVHLVVISNFPHWSGGWCYGPRFMTDALPAIYLLFVILLVEIYRHGSLLKKRLVTIFLFVTFLFSMAIHVPKGLYNHSSATDWNRFPARDNDYFFDWRYPQFLHTPQRQQSRIIDYKMTHGVPLPLGKTVRFDNQSLILPNWLVDKTVIWSVGKEAEILFRMDTDKQPRGVLKMRLGTLGVQTIGLSINGHQLKTEIVNSAQKPPLGSWDGEVVFEFDPKILVTKGSNKLIFELPNAHKPANGNPNVLAFALKTLRIE